jgi:hypothetical protein
MNPYDIDAIYYNLTPDELWALGKDATPSKVNWTAEEHHEFEQLCVLQDKTGLEFDVLRLILHKPQEATLSDIFLYNSNKNTKGYTEKPKNSNFEKKYKIWTQ